MAYYASTPFVPHFITDAGIPLSGGTITAFVAGTSTPANMYLDAAGTVAGTSISLNARGEPTVGGNTVVVWLDEAVTYKFVLKDASAVTKWTVDDIVSATAQLRTDLSTDDNTAKGAALIGYRDRTVHARLDDVVNVKDFGATGDGSTDDIVSIQAAVDAALAAGKQLYFPAGTYLCAGQITGSGKPVEIVGDGKVASRIVFTSILGGLHFTLDPQGSNIPPQRASVSGITIESRAVVGNPAAHFEWSAYQANAQGQFWASDFAITRADDGTGSFTSGLKLTKCFVGFLRDFVILGDDARASLYGLHLVDCVGIRVSAFDINRYQTGVRIEKDGAVQTEGILIRDGFIYDVNRGVHSPHQAIHINVVGTHININGSGAVADITLTDASQCIVEGNLLYFGGDAGDAANQDCIQIDQRSGNRVTNNYIVGITKANTRYGVVTSGATSYNSIDGNQISNATTGAFISSALDTANRVFNNEFFGCTTDFTDAGANTYQAGNTSSGAPISSVRWGTAGGFAAGEISANANHGGYLRGRSGSDTDLAFADSSNNVAAAVKNGVFALKSYAKASLPSASLVLGGCGLIYVTDDVGGATVAFSDGAAWHRVADRAVIA